MTQALFDLSFLERMLDGARRHEPDPAARRRLLRAQPPARAAPAQRGAGHRRPRARSRRACATPARTLPPSGSRSRRSWSRALAEARRRRLRDPAVPAARSRARALLAAAGRDRSARTSQRGADRPRRACRSPPPPPTWAAKIVDSTCPDASTAGPPELPWRTSPPSAVTCAQRSADEHVGRDADPRPAATSKAPSSG